MDNTQTNQVNPSPEPNINVLIDSPIDKPSKLHLGRCIKLYFERNVPESDIARLMNVSRQAVDQALRPYKQILYSKGELDLLRTRKEDLLESSFYRLLLDTGNEDKRDKASLNNTAFALGKVHEIYRLETNQSTQNTSSIIQVTPGSRQAMAGQMSKVRAIRGSFEGISQTIKTQDGDTVD
jgi:predicted DNA-binding protein YlxM (UPF0122 family)